MRENTCAYWKWAPFLALIWLAGCVSPGHLKTASTDLARSYGDANDQQLLLNLARLANDDPASFIQSATFSDQYTTSYGAGVTPSFVNNHPGFATTKSQSFGSTPPSGQDTVSSGATEYVKRALTLGGSATAAVSETPIFQFVPVTGSNFVDAILAPINEKVFDTFYDQDWEADWLARIMVASVQHQKSITKNFTAHSQARLTNFSTHDFSNFARLAFKLKQPDSPVSAFLLANLSAQTREDLHWFNESASEDNQLELQKKLARELNDIIQTKSVYDVDRFVGVSLRKETRDLIDSNVQGVTRQRLNRLLLEDVYTNEIIKGPPQYTPELETIFTSIVRTNRGRIYASLLTNYTALTITNYTYSSTTNYEIFVNNPSDSSYPQFLDFCNKLYYAQQHHRLTVGPKPGSETVIYNSKYTRLTDVVAAVQANLTAKFDPVSGQIKVSQPQKEKTLVESEDVNVNPDIGEDDFTDTTNFTHQFANKWTLKMLTVEGTMYGAAQEEGAYRRLEEDSDQSVATNNELVDELLRLKYFTTYRDAFNSTNCTTFHDNLIAGESGTPGDCFKSVDDERLKSLLNTTNEAAIKELQRITISAATFAKLMAITDNISYFEGTNGPYAVVIRTNRYPYKVMPLMRLTCQGNEKPPFYVRAKIKYSDAAATNGEDEYFVGDMKDDNQNRSVFTILSYLYAQTTIGAQNLPVQQLIQVQ